MKTELFDGLVLYDGSCDLIIDEDGIPWVFDLGEIGVFQKRKTVSTLQKMWYN